MTPRPKYSIVQTGNEADIEIMGKDGPRRRKYEAETKVKKNMDPTKAVWEYRNGSMEKGPKTIPLENKGKSSAVPRRMLENPI